MTIKITLPILFILGLLVIPASSMAERLTGASLAATPVKNSVATKRNRHHARHVAMPSANTNVVTSSHMAFGAVAGSTAPSPTAPMATTGPANAALTVNHRRIQTHPIPTSMISDNAVTTRKIAPGAVTSAKISGGAGSGVDADLLDGLHANGIIAAATAGGKVCAETVIYFDAINVTNTPLCLTTPQTFTCPNGGQLVGASVVGARNWTSGSISTRLGLESSAVFTATSVSARCIGSDGRKEIYPVAITCCY